jgi:predicted dehydrogenase
MEKVKLAMIGAGNIANTHLSSYAKLPNVEIYAACDINESRLNETCDKFGIERRYTDLDKMLAELPELDAADVCVWNVNHASCSIKALDAGLHVLCEKPMAYSAKEAEAMKAAADRNGKLLMIGFVLRFSDDAKIAMDFIEKGYLGDIYYAKAQYVRRHGNPGGWFANKELSGGGPIIDLGVHVIDLTRYLMGNPKPVSVYAVASERLGDRKYLKTGPGWVPKDAKEEDVCTVEDFATALIRYDNGACTFLETSYDINGEDIAKRQLFGTKGGMDLSNGVKIYSTVNNYLADIDVKTANLKGGQDMFTAEMAHFIDCVKNGTPCRAKAEDGIAVMKILDAIYESARTGHEVIL